MFGFFVIYVKNVFGPGILKQDNATYKLFCELIDTDGSLAVDLSELTEFFNQRVRFDTKQVNLGEQVGGQSVTLLMEVLDDFDEKNSNYDEDRVMEGGALRKGMEKKIVLEDGQ